MDEVAARDRHGPGRAPPPHADRGGRRGPDPAGVRRRSACSETLEKAVEMIGYGRDLPEDEAIGVACGWWPCVPAPSGAYVKLNGDGSRHDRHRRAGERHRRRDGACRCSPPRCSACSPRTSRSSTRTPTRARGTWARPARRRRSTTAAPCSAPRSEVREQLLDAAAEQLEADRGDLELAEGVVRVKGSPDRSVAIADLAGGRHGPRQGLGRRARRARPATPAAASAGSASSRSSRRS